MSFDMKPMKNTTVVKNTQNKTVKIIPSHSVVYVGFQLFESGTYFR